MKKSVGLLTLALVLAACTPSTRDSGMAGEVRTESQDTAGGEIETDMSGSMTGGDMDASDMEMATGGMTGGDMDMMDMGTGGVTGGSLDFDSFDTQTSSAQTGVEGDEEAPTGTLEVSASPAGPFYNDRPGGISDVSDERVVRALPGGSFFVRVNYSDPSGVSNVELSLRNSSEQGELPTASFTIDEAASTCDDQLAASPTELNCTLKVDVAPGTQNISEGGEFAYVFRARVADAAGNVEVDNDRGYVSLR